MTYMDVYVVSRLPLDGTLVGEYSLSLSLTLVPACHEHHAWPLHLLPALHQPAAPEEGR